MKEKLHQLLMEVSQELIEIDIPISKNIKEIKVNSRVKRRLGGCMIEKKPLCAPTYTIEISKHALDCSEDDIKRIIAHELLHTCPGCFDHGKKWQTYGALVEKQLGYEIRRTIDYKEIGIPEPGGMEKINYVIKCKNCGQEYRRKRMCPLIKNPEKYRCGKCGESLGQSKSLRGFW